MKYNRSIYLRESEYEDVEYEEDTPKCKTIERFLDRIDVYDLGLPLVREANGVVEVEFPDVELEEEDIEKIKRNARDILDIEVEAEEDGDYCTLFFDFSKKESKKVGKMGKRLKEYKIPDSYILTQEKVDDLLPNYKAYKANGFKPLKFVKDGKEIIVYFENEDDHENYTQHGTVDYINGWLYGIVQGKMKMFESKKSCRGKKLDEARPPKVDFDFDEIDIEATDIRELYAEDGVEGVVDLPWKNVKFNYPEFAKIFEVFCNYIYDGDVSIEDCWEYMDEPLYKAVMEYIDTRRKQDPVDLIKKYDKDLKVVLTTSPDPTPEDGDFEDEDDEDDYYYDFSDDEFLSPEEKRQMKDIETSVRSSRKK